MNRTTAAALIAAGIVGIAGGTVSAMVRGSDAPGSPTASPTKDPSAAAGSEGGTPSAEPSPSGTPTPAPEPSSSPGATPVETNEPLLYAAGGEIHDGDTVVAFTQGRVRRLVRAADGWLVASGGSPLGSAPATLWWVTQDSPARRLAEVSTWDPDAEGKRVVAYDVKAGQVKVWSLPDRTVTGRYATEGSPVLTPAFAGHDVLIAQDLGSRIDLVRWDPDTGRSRITQHLGYDDLSLSPGGSYLAGAVGQEGISVDANTCLRVESTFLKSRNVGWTTCDWRGDSSPVRFSPDGTRLIAIPSDSDGFGPGEFGILDASDGPRKLVATIDAPDWTLGAQWADNDHLYVYGSNTDDPATGGTWIRRCDLQGACTEVARSKQVITVGSGL